MMIIVFMMVMIVITGAIAIEKESFVEELLIRPLADGKVLSHFQFTTTVEGGISSRHAGINGAHYRRFPRSLGDIISASYIEELHLSFTQGYWRSEHWGFAPRPSPTGSELLVWFEDNGEAQGERNIKNNTDTLWHKATHALSGYFGASLNFLDEAYVATPKFSYFREGMSFSNDNSSSRMRYGALPRESVCTENLTPFIKLLPCNERQGLAALLKGRLLFDSNFVSFAVDVRPVCLGGNIYGNMCTGVRGVEMIQTVSVVFDPVRMNGQRDWTLALLFSGRSIAAPCLLTKSTSVFLDVSSDLGEFELTLEPSTIIEDHDTFEKLVVYNFLTDDWTAVQVFNSIGMRWPMERSFSYLELSHAELPVPVTTNRYVAGHGQISGNLILDMTNHVNTPLRVVVFETVPWYLRVMVHTLRVANSPSSSFTDEIYSERAWMSLDESDAVEHLEFSPAIDRIRPAVIEIVLTLPPMTTVTFSLGFSQAFLRISEHHPDANRGFDFLSPVVTLYAPSSLMRDSRHYWRHFYGLEWSPNLYPRFNSSSRDFDTSNADLQMILPIRTYAESVLVAMPIPDFSMPYNVITITSTILALAFGNFYNIAVRRFVRRIPIQKSPRNE